MFENAFLHRILRVLKKTFTNYQLYIRRFEYIQFYSYSIVLHYN